MKRILPILLALCLAVSCAAAEALPAQEEAAPAPVSYPMPDTVSTVTYYTHPTYDYTILCPDQWILLDNTSLDAFLSETADPAHPYAKLNANFSLLADNIRQYQIFLMTDPDTGVNINIVPQSVGAHLDADALIESVMPSVNSQLKAQFSGAEILNPGAKVTVGSNEFAVVSLEYTQLAQSFIMQQYYIMNADLLLTITFTTPRSLLENQQEELENMLVDVLGSLTFI